MIAIKHNIRCFAVTAALLGGIAAQSATAAPVEDLYCLEDQLTVEQRAAIGALFTEQTDDPTSERKLAKGSKAASGDFAAAIGGCSNRLGWDETERRAAEQYLLRLGAVSQIAVTNGTEWSSAMERYAPFAARQLNASNNKSDGDITDHQRAMVVAGAKANGVPSLPGDEGEESPVIEFVKAWIELETDRETFKQT